MRSKLYRILAGLGVTGLAVVVLLGAGWVARSGCGATPKSDGVRLTAQQREGNDLIFDATVELDAPASVYLEYGGAGAEWLRTPTSGPASIHRLPVVRLRAESTYELRTFAVGADGCPTGYASVELETDAPPTQLRRIRVEANGRPSFPLTLMDLRMPSGDVRWLIVLDQDSQLVWYAAVPKHTAGAAVPISNHHIAVVPGGSSEAFIVTPDARIARRIKLTGRAIEALHHDVLELEDGRLMFLASEIRLIDDRVNGGAEQLPILGDALYVYDPARDTSDRVWSAFDVFDPTDRPEHWRRFYSPDSGQRANSDDFVWSWTHTNTIARGVRGNFLLSLRSMDQVVSLSPDDYRVEWRLGGPGSSFRFPDPSDRFWGQHAVIELAEGRLLLFDNGNFRPEGEYSRALELELDFASMTARKVWEYRHSPDVLSDRVSNAIRLPGGGTLVNFGFRSDEPTAPVVLAETRPDGEAAWVQTLRHPGGRVSRYRVYPLDTIAGERPAEPTSIQH